MNEAPVVLIYQFFYPDYSAGGPVTSLGNLAKALGQRARVITSSKVFSTGKEIEGIATDTWSSWYDIPVWYATERSSIQRAITSLPSGSTLYLNGLFLPDYFVYPLRLAHKLGHCVIISPRGMLQLGALRHGSLRKKVFIRLLNSFWLNGHEVWHATDDVEREDIVRWIRRPEKVVVVPNLPTMPSPTNAQITKESGTLRLIYYSLIAQKKNLSFLLNLLMRGSLQGVSLDIAGPVKDADYWKECQALIASLPRGVSVRYIGEQNPATVHDLLSRYHLFVLPTLGENFGHAIVESLSSFRPVLISNNTPWTDIAQHRAGYSLPLDHSAWTTAITEALQWDQPAFDQHAAAAMQYFTMKLQPDILRDKYLKLFAAANQ